MKKAVCCLFVFVVLFFLNAPCLACLQHFCLIQNLQQIKINKNTHEQVHVQSSSSHRRKSKKISRMSWAKRRTFRVNMLSLLLDMFAALGSQSRLLVPSHGQPFNNSEHSVLTDTHTHTKALYLSNNTGKRRAGTQLLSAPCRLAYTSIMVELGM